MKQIFLALLIMRCLVASAQSKWSGVVLDQQAKPIPQVVVQLQNSQLTVRTDKQGNFSMESTRAPGSSEVLSFAHPDYQSLVLEVNQSAEFMRIVLLPRVGQLQELTITTQKRKQNSYEVPIAVSALSGQMLERHSIRQLDEMSEHIPGLQVQLQSPNNPGYVIRGITSDDGDSRSQPRVSVFQDGVSISQSRASVVELFDLERIEVAKGPQGTLFGRGAEIGAIHLIQNKAKMDWSAGLNLAYGAYNNIAASGYINTPLSDKLANRLAFNFESRDGFIGNLSGGRLNGKKTYALRNSTRLFHDDNSTVDLILNFQADDYPGTGFKSKKFPPAGGDTDANTFADLEDGKDLYIKRQVGGASLLINQFLSDTWSLNSTTGFRKFYSDEAFDADGTAAPILSFSEIAKGDQFSQEFRLNFDNKKSFTGFLGASYFYENSSQEVPMRINEQYLYPAYIAPLLEGQLIGGIEQFAKAMGLPPQVLAGIKAQVQQLFQVPPPLIDGVPQPVATLPNLQPLALNLINQLMPGQLPPGITWEQLVQSGAMAPGTIPPELMNLIGILNGAPIKPLHRESFANYGRNHAVEVFGDAALSLAQNLKLTAGIRLSYENQRGGYFSATAQTPSVFGFIVNGSPNILNPIANNIIYDSKDYMSYVGRLGLNYLFEKNNVYASVSRGRRPGVVSVLPEKTTFLNPEIIWSYEVGLKGQLSEDRLNYDLGLYYYDWNHFQTSTLQEVPGSIAPQWLLDDGGKAHSLGLEASLSYKLRPELTLFSTYAYIDGKFDEKDENGLPQIYAGNRFRLTPKASFSVGMDAEMPLSEQSALYLRPTASYKSGVYFEDSNREDLYQPGYALVNFNAGYKFKVNQAQCEIGAYGKNILNKKYLIDAGNSGDNIGFPTYIGGGKSLVGAQFKINF